MNDGVGHIKTATDVSDIPYVPEFPYVWLDVSRPYDCIINLGSLKLNLMHTMWRDSGKVTR